MSAVNSDSIRAGAAGVSAGYTIDNSCRFNPADDPRTRVTFGTVDNNKIFSCVAWIKRGNISTSADVNIFGGKSGNGGTSYIAFLTGDTLDWSMNTDNGSALTLNIVTTQLFRDPSAWFQLLFVHDSTQSTASDRAKIYLNGVQITSFVTETYMAEDAVSYDFNATGKEHTIGAHSGNTREFDGYLAQVGWADGIKWATSDVGETDDQGNWVPIDISGLDFGSEGFLYDFAVAPGTGDGAGTDVSGNANHATDNGLATNDQMTDSPTDSTGDDLGNYPTGNPLNQHASLYTLSDGNLTTKQTDGAQTSGGAATVALPLTGKWYWEVTCGTTSGGGEYPRVGTYDAYRAYSLVNTVSANAATGSQTGEIEYGAHGRRFEGGSATDSWGATFTTDDVIGIAVDTDASKIWFAKNNSWQASGDPAAGSNEANAASLATDMFPGISGYNNSTATYNFGASSFAYTPPSGFKSLSTANLPAPAVTDSSQFFQVDTFTGTGAELVITLTDGEGGAVSPDITWIKDRTAGFNQVIYDSERGATKEFVLNTTDAETTVAQGVKSFDASGVTLGTDGDVNTSSSANMGYYWVESVTAGIDIVTDTGTGLARTQAHNLGVIPDAIIRKNRLSTAGRPTTLGLGAAGWTKYINMASTSGPATASDIWNDTNPTTSVFSLGTGGDTNESGGSFITYLFASIEGFSKFGKYVGNGTASPDGTFVWCGFRPAWIYICKDASESKHLYDIGMNPYNPASQYFQTDTTNAEASSSNRRLDFLSNGFGLDSESAVNASGVDYFYMAFAEFPFGGSGVSQARAR